MAIGKIRKLYAIEKRIRDLDPEEKTRQRQEPAVLNKAGATGTRPDLKAWLEKNDFHPGTQEQPDLTRACRRHPQRSGSY